ncbi:zinc finger CCCH domain-containing protein 4-like [Anthonomus grandis grandis]|uniref:zinc finger CCCH domain-containing protein 4-like n=1 Tax=Anthonomus grandis grandis TaxID=2921223 RepID=UPI0021664F33|nr:zinc finger CCCH domain-containing protein 4-like [Anthonomus grandis grandis]
MSETERGRKPHYVRRNPPSRPPPGVQKAMQNFGVRDLREILDKKHQDQGGEIPQNEKKKMPPPDPSYNYLKDPARDRPSSPPHKREPKKQPQQFYQNPKLHRSKTDPNIKNDNSTEPSEKDTSETVTKKKEIRFSDNPKPFEREQQNYNRGRGSFRSRGRPRRSNEDKVEQIEKIENPVNIKIELSTETGRRSYVLDDSTKIADIKHVPDNSPSARPSRGTRGHFRGRGRGRGRPFRGRGSYNKGEKPRNSESDQKTDEQEHDSTEQVDNEGNEGEVEKPNDATFDPSLAETITITSSNFEDGEVKRSVDIMENGAN